MLIVDEEQDIYGPSMPIMFDVANERPLAKNIDGVSKMVPAALCAPR